MKRNHRTSEPGSIEALARQATDYALHMMRTAGSVPPTVIADTESGYVFCMPTALTDEATKDHFAEVARLFAIAHSARALVLIAEAWATLPDASGHLDTETPPSMSPNRQEIVALMLEDRSQNATSLVPIVRGRNGTFQEFGTSAPITFGQSAGRFAGLMPQQKPSNREVAQARLALAALGLDIVNRGFDPTLN